MPSQSAETINKSSKMSGLLLIKPCISKKKYALPSMETFRDCWDLLVKRATQGHVLCSINYVLWLYGRDLCVSISTQTDHKIEHSDHRDLVDFHHRVTFR